MSDRTHGITDDADPKSDAEPLGQRVGTDALRFERSFSVPVERVWEALTTGAGLAAWLGRATAIDLAVGGRFEIALGASDRMDGRVIELEPHRRLVIEWHETSEGVSSPYGTLAGDTSVVSFDLAPTPDGSTSVIFMHRYIRAGETMAGFGAGWHMHLEALSAALAQSSPVDRERRYAVLRPRYDALAR